MRTVILAVLTVAALLSLSGCVADAIPGAGKTVFGMASCRPQDMVHCTALAGKTHRTNGPGQIEYMAPDGQLYLWIGDTIRRGQWSVAPGFGGLMCYQYGQGFSSQRNCEKLSTDVRRRDEVIDGDPFGLASRASPPLHLGFFERRNFSQLLAELGSE